MGQRALGGARMAVIVIVCIVSVATAYTIGCVYVRRRNKWRAEQQRIEKMDAETTYPQYGPPGSTIGDGGGGGVPITTPARAYILMTAIEGKILRNEVRLDTL